MGFFDRWRRGEGAGRGPSLFEPWPPGPLVIRPIPVARRVSLSPLLRTAEGRADPFKFSPALVIGLGPTGELVLDALASELALDVAGPQQLLRLVLLSSHPSRSGALSSRGLTRRFDLGSLDPAPLSTDNSTSLRKPLLDRFLRPTIYDAVASYFRGALSDLRADAVGEHETRIIIIGGLGEPEIGLLGNLMLLLLQAGDGRGISSRMALLAVDSAAPQLTAAEEEATLRELGRLTFIGPHVLPHQASQPESAAANALIDYLLLVQNAGGLQRHEPDARPFALGVGQALTEIAYMLLHPSGGSLWTELQNELKATGNARDQTHATYVYGAGAATLFVPVTELQDYIAARLAMAVVYGEQNNNPEGLLSRRLPLVSHEGSSAAIVRGWLQDEPLAHRLLTGLLDATGPDSFRHPPPVTSDAANFVHLLPAQVAHGLVTLLNDGQPDSLQRANAGLTRLKGYLENWRNWARSAGVTYPSDANHTLKHIFEQWQAQIEDMHRQLTAWQAALGSNDGKAPVFTASPAGLAPPLPGNVVEAPSLPKASAPPPLPGRARQATAPGLPGVAAAPTPVLRDLLERRRDKATSNLQAITGGAARRPLTADRASDASNGLHEANKYYSDTVRPELDQFITEPSAAYIAVAQRLRWWVKLTRSAPPELLLLCIPVNAALPSGSELPPESAIFSPSDMQRLAETLLDISAVQTQKTGENLTASWMLGRLQAVESRHFLRRAESVYLNINAEEARVKYLESLATHPFLLGPDANAINVVVGHVFPTIAANAVTHVVGGEPTRLSALLVQTDIPLDAVRLPKPTRQTYGASAGLYLYEQERLAAEYEAKVRGLRERQMLFPPDFVVALTQPDLVRLFCHGLAAGIIVARPPKLMSDQLAWSVPFDPSLARPDEVWLPWENNQTPLGRSPALDVAELKPDNWADDARRDEWLLLADHDSLREWQSVWAAMRAFTLQLPFNPSLAAQPIHPFNRDNQEQFLRQLRQAIRDVRERVEGEAALTRRTNSLLSRLGVWRQQAPQDALVQAFCNVLELELARPGSV